MQKKLQATHNAEVNIKETSGGTKLELNTGIYEIMNVATDIFYSADRNEMKYRKTEAKKRQGYVIETRYKSSRGRNNRCTLNMYQTKCSCLVNGRNVAQCMDEDLQQNFQIVQNELSETSLTEINESIET